MKKKVVLRMVKEKKRGRPKSIWLQRINEELQTSTSTKEAERTAEDRDGGNNFIKSRKWSDPTIMLTE